MVPIQHTQQLTRKEVKPPSVCRQVFIFTLLTLGVLFGVARTTEAATVSGTLYSDEGVTQYTTAGKTITLKVDGAGSYSTTTTAGVSAWYINSVTVSTSSVITVFFDGDATLRGTTVTVASSSVNNITGIDLYKDRLVMRSVNGTTTTFTNATLNTYDQDNDADIPVRIASGNLTASSGMGVYVWGNSIYTSGGTITLTDGDFTVAQNATTTLSATTSVRGLTIQTNGSLVAPDSLLTIQGLFSNQGAYDHNAGTLLISNSQDDNTSFLSGREIGGGSWETGELVINSLVEANGMLYLAKESNDSACDVAVGDDAGCELLVFDLSSSTDPVPVAGRDSNGDVWGSEWAGMLSLAVSGNTLYVGKEGYSTACDPTVGNAIGCELMVFDISSTTNPVFVTGRDVSGNDSGTDSIGIRALTVRGSTLYVGKYGEGTACDPTEGNAVGCELMVFNISSTTNPTFVTGRDVSGDNSGTGWAHIHSFAILGSTLYVAKSGDGTACDPTAGNAIGCELLVFNISTPTSPSFVTGRDASGDDSGTVTLDTLSLSVSRTMLYVGRYGDSTACDPTVGNAIGCELIVFDISTPTSPSFVTGRDTSGDDSGTGSAHVYALSVQGTQLYAVKSGNAEMCNNVPGLAGGCELMVFDISSSTYPFLANVRDGSGAVSGSSGGSYRAMLLHDDVLYVANASNGSGCTSSAGGAAGCKLIAYDGRPLSGLLLGSLSGETSLHHVTASGTVAFKVQASTTNLTILSTSTLTAPSLLTVVGDYTNNGTFLAERGTMFIASTSAQTLSGTMTGTSSLHTVVLSGSGTKTLQDDMTVTNLINTSGSALVAPPTLTVTRTFTNDGTFTHDGGLVEITTHIADYLAGRDAGTGSAGTDSGMILALATAGNYLYVGKVSNGDACSQTVGSANGCELLVYDISSTTNPVYVAGRDSDGSDDGTGMEYIWSMAVAGEYLYVGKDANDTACSQTAGAAGGCEIMVFDISSSTNPVYVAGRDADGGAVGTSSMSVYSMAVSDNALYVGKLPNSLPCSQVAGAARGCELMVFDISSGANPVYVAGRDVDGSASGTGYQTIHALVTAGTSLFVGKDGSSVACSEVVGSADGCELMVFDISSTTNPVFVAGRDVDGSNSGSESLAVRAMTVAHSTLYVGKEGDATVTACSQTAGSAVGCEFMAFDVSSSTNPVYVAGRDIDASAAGAGYGHIYAMSTIGRTLYVGKNGWYETCSSVLGSAGGCDIQVYDISSSTNPVYVAGHDSGGDMFGTDTVDIRSLAVSDRALYVGKADNATPCSQTAGSAEGCELMVFNIYGTLAGSFTGASALNEASIKGRGARMTANASTTDLSVATGTMLIAPAQLSVGSTFANGGTFTPGTGTVYLTGATNTLTGTTTFYNLTKLATTTATTTFGAGSTYTIQGAWTMQGVSTSSPHHVRSSTEGEYWYVDAPGTRSLQNLTVKDSYNASSTNLIICAAKWCTDLGHNTNWSFPVAITLRGYVYRDQGNVLHTNTAQTLTVYALGSTYSTTSATGTGAWSYTDIPVATGTPVVVWLDNDSTFRGSVTTVTPAANPADITNLDLYKDSVIVRSEESGVSVTNTTLNTYDQDNDADIPVRIASGNLTASSGTGVYVWGNTTYTANGTLTLTLGDLTVASNATTTLTATTSVRSLTVKTGASLTAPQDLTVRGSLTNYGTYTHNSGTLTMDAITAEVAAYVAGRDVTGSDSGSGDVVNIYGFIRVGNYLYVGKSTNNTPCSQAAGSAIGCELMIFDISSSTNPVYVAGRDSSGSSSGSSSGGEFVTFAISGDYLYVGKGGSIAACSQVAGSAQGCELMVFNISSTTNPIYVAGRDASGNSTGTAFVWISQLAIVGNYLYVGKWSNTSACSQIAGSAQGCELMVFDISSSTNPVYVAGRDSSGSAAGTGFPAITSLAISGNYLYAGKWDNSTACSQVAGSAVGCEIIVFDISSSTNPVYVAGRDGRIGDSSSSDGVVVNALAIYDHYLYVGKNGDNFFECSAVPTSGAGCEIMVFDISSSTNPVYVTGLDANGASYGYGYPSVNTLSVSGNYLYAGKEGDLTACSQTAGIAVGCEIMVFDISSSTNPVYVAGQDTDGSRSGAGYVHVDELLPSGGYLYVGKVGNGTPCSQTTGSADGCELMVLDMTPPGTLLGNLTGVSALNDVVASGTVVFQSNASTSKLTIQSMLSSLRAPNQLSATGDYTNHGTFHNNAGAVYIDGVSSQNLSGSMVGSSSFYDLIVAGSGTKTFSANASTSNLTITTGSTLTAPSILSVFNSFTNHGTFLHNNGLLDMKGYLTNYMTGVDSTGSMTGSGDGEIYALAVSGNYLYVGKYGDPTPCSQTPGSADGCELMVFDISSSTNPVYVAGRDASGDSGGTGDGHIFTLAVSGNYLYAGKGADATACSQTAGSALGCELMVFDISSSTNPVYVAGRDASGDSGGTGDGYISTLAVSGNYLYAGKQENATACSQTAGSAIGCELMVFDISSSTNPVYVAGRDASGDSGGTGSVPIYTLIISGNHLYAGKGADATACSQTAGSALGCELMVFDISSSTNPVYVAGRDASGDSGGTGSVSSFALTTLGTSLYMGKSSDGTACDPTVGNAIGCELLVFDVSSTTNPVLTTARDSDGSSAGLLDYVAINTLTVSGNYLLVGKQGNGTVCSQAAGSAAGCELMVFDLASTTDPLYIAGTDVSGAPTGASAWSVYTLAVSGNYLYAVQGGNWTACSQTARNSIGCELMVFGLPTLSGTMTGTSAWNNLSISGQGAELLSNASTTNLSIASNATLVAPSQLSIGNTLTNSGTFTPNQGTVHLTSRPTHTVTGTTTFYNLSKVATTTATTTFGAGSTYTIQGTWTMQGAGEAALHHLRSSEDGQRWYVNPQGARALDRLSVKDSHNKNETPIYCALPYSCTDAGNNENWQFIFFASDRDQVFQAGQATTTLARITFMEGLATGTVKAAADMRITIATSTTNFRFDPSGALSFGGTAASKVSSVYTLADNGATLVLDVTSDFVAGDTLTIDGIPAGSFTGKSATTSRLALHLDGDSSGTPAAYDLQSMFIGSALTLADHTAGQVINRFIFGNTVNVPLFVFRMTPGENATVTSLSLTLSTAYNLGNGQTSNLRLYRDVDNDGAYSVGDVLLGSGTLAMSGFHGTISFDGDFVATSADNYVVVADFATPFYAHMTTIELLPDNISGIAVADGLPMAGNGSVTPAEHYQGRAKIAGGAASSSAPVGGYAAPGVLRSGGSSNAGTSIEPVDPGDTIGNEVGFYIPTITGAQYNEWTNGTNALTSDGSYASAASEGLRQTYTGFNFNIPSGNTITGIAVKLEASGSTAAGTIDIVLSWDNGTTTTSAKTTPTLTASDGVYTIGGDGDTWGQSWTPFHFSNDNFHVRVIAHPSSNTVRIDALQVSPYHQATGGSSGGGGAI